MDTAPETPKAKRHYTVTDKVREARRASLAKAREKARQAPRGYERGDHEDVAYKARLARQLKPWCANLRRAAAAKKADRSADYASRSVHGLTAPDLDRSAAAAGEDRQELRQHIERCQRVIGGLIENCRLKIDDCRLPGSADPPEWEEVDGPRSKVEDSKGPSSIGNQKSSIDNDVTRHSKLALALAYLLWRTLRLVRRSGWTGRCTNLPCGALAARAGPGAVAGARRTPGVGAAGDHRRGRGRGEVQR